MRNFPCSGGLVVLATARVISVATAQEVPNFQFRFTEKPGPYSVGHKVIEQYDRSRVFHSTIDGTGKSATVDGFRPLQTLVWYPAEASLAAISRRQSSSSRCTTWRCWSRRHVLSTRPHRWWAGSCLTASSHCAVYSKQGYFEQQCLTPQCLRWHSGLYEEV